MHCGTFVLTALLLSTVVRGDGLPTRLPSSSSNFASAYLGAKVVEHSSEMKGVHHLLKDDASYMIVPCNVERKRFTIQLSREVNVRTVVLSNLEYFSSTVESFMLLGSREFPCVSSCKWTVFGRFTANFTREPQTFDLASAHDMLPAVRYLRLLWLSSHGKELSCTLTTMLVFGYDRWDLVSTLMSEVESPVGDDVSAPDPHNATSPMDLAYRPVLPSWPPWREPVEPLVPLNTSNCPKHKEAKDIEVYFEARERDSAICPTNVTKPTVHPMLLFGESTVLIQRQVAAVRKDVVNLTSRLDDFAAKRHVRELAQDLLLMKRRQDDILQAVSAVEAAVADLRAVASWALVVATMTFLGGGVIGLALLGQGRAEPATAPRIAQPAVLDHSDQDLLSGTTSMEGDEADELGPASPASE
jgi:hypothetical protein